MPLTALARAEAHDLLAAATLFERSNLLLLAAGAAAQAAVLHRRRGELGQAAAAMALARRYEKCHEPVVAASSLPLTGREREVACLAAAGLSNREIATRLQLSVRTVEGHVYRACIRLGVSDRTGLTGLIGRAPTPAACPRCA